MSLRELNDQRYSFPTRLIHGKSLTPEWDYSHHVIPPMTASSTFRLDSSGRGAKGFCTFGKQPVPGEELVFVYDRLGEPNNNMLQYQLAVAEGGEAAVTFATGMAAVHAAVCFSLRAGDEVIAHQTLYGCTYSLLSHWLPRMGVQVTFADLTCPVEFNRCVSDRTKIVYLESPVNPTLEILDLEKISADIAEENQHRTPERRILSIIDNTFATPWCQRPIGYGVDIVVHSLTKGLSGFGTDMGGAVITRGEFLEELLLFRKDFGGNLAPQTAWHMLVYGLPTLSLRIPKQQENALAVAQFLESHPEVDFVRYPGLESFPQYSLAERQMRDYQGDFAPGIMLYFALKGENGPNGVQRAARFIDYIADNSYTVTLAVSLGQLRTLIEHPASMTHSSYSAEEQRRRGFHATGIRLAVGIEDVGDIIRDLDEALRSTR